MAREERHFGRTWSRGERVVVLGDAPMLLRASEILAARGVRMRRLAGVPRAGLPPDTTTLLLAEDLDLGAHLQAAGALAGKRRDGLRVIVLAVTGAGAADDVLDADGGQPGLRVEWLDPYRAAARALLSRWPLHSGFDPVFGQTLHLVIDGFGPLSRAVALHAMRIGQYADAPPVLTLMAEPGAWAGWIDAEHPMATECAQLRFPDDAEAAALAAPVADPVPSLLLIAGGPMGEALGRARRLMCQSAAVGGSPLVLLAADGDWVPGPLAAWDGQLLPVRALELGLSPEVLLGGRDDVLAEVVHEHYRDTSAAQGRDPAAAPSGRPWAQLATSYRDANRHQADHLPAKLAVTDCRAMPEELVESFVFTPAEVERLAIIEHRRWAVERWLDGWRYGASRDNAAKRHPQLIPYDDLSGPMKDLDRFAVRLVPTLLARMGQGVVRRLIVGVQTAPNGGEAPSDRALRRAAMQVLKRLLARYPDRAMTIVLDPADAQARVLASLASRRFGAALFLLLSRPLSDLLAQAGDQARVELLELLRDAERRIPLPGVHGIEGWLARRAAVRCVLGVDAGSDAPRGANAAKLVSVDAQGRVAWGFEY